jgi:Mitochondrial ribosomal protein subunit L20
MAYNIFSSMPPVAVVPIPSFFALRFSRPFWWIAATRRNQSSYRRSKQRLRIKPDASFGPPDQPHDHIIYNPPSSSPSVYDTPTKFLPADDLRRILRAQSGSDSAESPKLPLVFKDMQEKKYHLTQADIEEIRRLRLSDPITWSRWRLAKRFDCSPLFIAMVCEASPQKKEIQKQVLEAVRSRWGAKRRLAREDRQLRKERWGTDE